MKLSCAKQSLSLTYKKNFNMLVHFWKQRGVAAIYKPRHINAASTSAPAASKQNKNKTRDYVQTKKKAHLQTFSPV